MKVYVLLNGPSDTECVGVFSTLEKPKEAAGPAVVVWRDCGDEWLGDLDDDYAWSGLWIAARPVA